MSKQQSYRCRIIKEGNLTAIPIPFDPKAVFGKVRAPVVVQLSGYEYRSKPAPHNLHSLHPLDGTGK